MASTTNIEYLSKSWDAKNKYIYFTGIHQTCDGHRKTQLNKGHGVRRNRGKLVYVRTQEKLLRQELQLDP